MKPIIGLTPSVQEDGSVSLLEAYSRAIEQAGGIPILLPYVKNSDTLDGYTDICDGFFFTGGVDVSPELYGEDKRKTCGNTQPLRDEMELYILEKALQLDKPILAVCRGVQILNVALGGSLYQDIPTEIKTDINHVQKESRFEPSHSVTIYKNTPLEQLIGKGEMIANSFHHQAIKALGNDLSVMAKADDGIIEAVYMEDKKYIRGYQWHPERLCFTNDDNKKIFLEFIKAADNSRRIIND
ncbi:MAG: gamma-glutamyl-gamma-aminobutyrate hydrolase family protein [Clostridia bacterium]|nr:gamma-glutamyl-gamma-aminobutyrate hydrolase family protein [Clostridia bacterium]